ncbi:probable G-protein coupled receptor 160 [Misgurnus anguillicaudatus]|uniref:probable G-protein coupled receptor 160 n=1 Tax=Misgurnus anguillicaudatus TaxID=75329 RepID=UPI003CCFB8FC
MDTLLPSLLLLLWLKSFINWVVVTIQRHYVIRSFSGFFCISLALTDSFLSFIITAIYYLEDFNLSGWRLTRHHVCLLVQIACFICSVLHWPVFLLTLLDNLWTLSSSKTTWTQKLTYVVGVCLLWILATLYIFWVADVVLLLGDDKHCHVFSSSQSVQVLSTLLLTVTCVLFYSFTSRDGQKVQVFLHSTRGDRQICMVSLRQIMYTFLNTWAPFIILMIMFPFLQTEMNALLQMNTVWLCFLNSFSMAMALCSRPFEFSETITDGFCSWSFCFVYGAENQRKGHFQV